MTQKNASTAVSEEKTVKGRVARILKPNTAFVNESLSYREPGPDEVLLRLQACGVCHSDSFAVTGAFPGLKYPIVPGHEIVGIVEQLGANVVRLKKGDRVGVGWHGGHCHQCQSCRTGDFVNCVKLDTPGITRDGGYAEYAVFPEEVCALVPEKLSSAEAAPMLCAGITTFNALRNAGARPGDVVAIVGIGGLGHFGIQYANKMGFHTVAIARGDDKAEFSERLGAHMYINSESKDAVERLKKLGGAKVVLATATSSKAISPWVDALTTGGKLVIVGASIEPLDINPIQLLQARRSIVGWPSGSASDSEDCLKFSALTGVRPMIETYPLERAGEAYERMMSGKARFRVVIEI